MFNNFFRSENKKELIRLHEMKEEKSRMLEETKNEKFEILKIKSYLGMNTLKIKHLGSGSIFDINLAVVDMPNKAYIRELMVEAFLRIKNSSPEPKVGDIV